MILKDAEKRDLTSLLCGDPVKHGDLSETEKPKPTQEVRGGSTPGADQNCGIEGSSMLFIDVYKNRAMISFYHPKDVFFSICKSFLQLVTKSCISKYPSLEADVPTQSAVGDALL